MFIIILEKPYILKRFYKKHTISKYNKIPPSYQSRINEGVDCPRNPTHFSDAYVFLGRAKIESSLKSFQLELLNRSLPSPIQEAREDGETTVPKLRGVPRGYHCVLGTHHK
jgi:hypothetical protein